jgi:hypothetical protein
MDKVPAPPNRHAVEAWADHEFRVLLCEDGGGARRLEVQRTADPYAPISWETLQRLKAEVGYADWWAVEMYPPTDHVINVAPLRHLFLLDSRPPFAWTGQTAAFRSVAGAAASATSAAKSLSGLL